MARLMDRLAGWEMDRGTAHFDPSTLAVVSIETGNGATNVIPGSCRGTVNIRFNDLHSGTSLSDWLRAEAAAVADSFGVEIELDIKVSGESFLTPPGELSALVSRAVTAETGLVPELSTTGGTSDARFVKDHCPVVEFGLVGKTMHQVDECVPVAEVVRLKAIYTRILRAYFR
jgi:succinyl-diaminopimelate desuccinylase